MDRERMFELVQQLAVAKSRQDVPAALKVLHQEMVLETPAFGSRVRGLAENEQALQRFFRSFPDYNVVLEDYASTNDKLVCWGRVRMTMTGERFGVVPNGKRVDLPVFIQFAFRDDRIVHERFMFDLAELCVQSGVSTDAVRQKLFAQVPQAA